jgi:sugar phosphate isomerase/epimerase
MSHAQLGLGVNAEFVRSGDHPFEYAVEQASRLGYEYFEPCLLNGRDLLAEAGYYHFRSMDEDPIEVRDQLAAAGLKASAVSAHAPLTRPDVGVPYIRRAIRYASDLGAPIVNTDAGLWPKWMDDKLAWQMFRYSLTVINQTAERYGIKVGIEPHDQVTTKVDGLLRLVELVPSPWIGINFDTGNSYLAGSDPVHDLKQVAEKVIHVHAKDIAFEHAERERGHVTGTPVGCACGDGAVDWRQVVQVLKDAGYQGVLSVECGTVEQAERSIAHLKEVLAQQAGRVPVGAVR